MNLKTTIFASKKGSRHRLKGPGQQVVGMFGVGAVVLAVREPCGQAGEERIQDLHHQGVDHLEGEPSPVLVERVAQHHEDRHSKEEANERDLTAPTPSL